MTAEPELEPDAAPKWSRMPGHVRLALDEAIEAHLKTHGRNYYDLLRGDARFSPWIGSHLGARGEKRLDRYIRAVNLAAAEQRKRRADRASRPAHQTALILSDGEEAAPEQLAAKLAHAGNAVFSVDELQGEYRLQLFQLEQAIEGALNPDGTVRDRDTFVKLLREKRAVVRDSATLAKQFHTAANASETIRRFLDRLLATAGAEPHLVPAISQAFAGAFHDQTGLAPTKGD
jgi:hypothetical protein